MFSGERVSPALPSVLGDDGWDACPEWLRLGSDILEGAGDVGWVEESHGGLDLPRT